MKILITGGHLTPALAVIQKLPNDVKVIYVGRKYALEGDKALSLEYQTISKTDIAFVCFQPGRLQRKFTKYTLNSLGRIPIGILEAFGILNKTKPDIILSFGGYVSFPICLAGAVLRIPIVVHEQTLEVGGTNRIISKLATKICASWESSLKFFPKEKVTLTGNPLLISNPSKEIKEIFKNKPKKYPVLAITGGSIGSHAINSFIEPILEKLVSKYFILHQTGDAKEFNDFARLSEVRSHFSSDLQKRYILRKFFHPNDIGYVYESSDLVISRSGINTVINLLLADTPCILIPLLFSQRNEQLKNAMLVKKSGLGEIMVQSEITPEKLFSSIESMATKLSEYKNKDIEYFKKLHEDAAEKIVKVIYDTKNKLL